MMCQHGLDLLQAEAREAAVSLVPTSFEALHMWLPRLVLNLGLVGLIGTLSIPVVRNLLSKRQVMNRSFDQWHIVGTYGAFGTVTKERYEVVVEVGAVAVLPSPPQEEAEGREDGGSREALW